MSAHWSPVKCGRSTPAACQAIMTSPEQSNPYGPAPPHTYGLPSCASAYATASARRPASPAGIRATGGRRRAWPPRARACLVTEVSRIGPEWPGRPWCGAVSARVVTCDVVGFVTAGGAVQAGAVQAGAVQAKVLAARPPEGVPEACPPPRAISSPSPVPTTTTAIAIAAACASTFSRAAGRGRRCRAGPDARRTSGRGDDNERREGSVAANPSAGGSGASSSPASTSLSGKTVSSRTAMTPSAASSSSAVSSSPSTG